MLCKEVLEFWCGGGLVARLRAINFCFLPTPWLIANYANEHPAMTDYYIPVHHVCDQVQQTRPSFVVSACLCSSLLLWSRRLIFGWDIECFFSICPGKKIIGRQQVLFFFT